MQIVSITPFKKHTAYKLPLFTSTIPAGFPSPADDFIEKTLDLNELLVKHPTATFFVRVDGDGMDSADIRSGDILIVDRALEVVYSALAIVIMDGELKVARVTKDGEEIKIVSQGKILASDIEIWGVVTSIIHRV